VIPSAGFIKAQAYVSLTHSQSVYLTNLTSTNLKLTDSCHSSAHFIDPSLRAILESSFIPDDNDLFITNLVDTPTLVIHGCALNCSISDDHGLTHT
jgi:hypothetical protein